MNVVKTAKSFIRQYKAQFLGDQETVQEEKALREALTVLEEAKAAFKIHISIMEGDIISHQKNIQKASDKLDNARVNFGNADFNRDKYIQAIIDAKSNLEQAQTNLDVHNETLEFLKAEQVKLDAEEEKK